MTVLRKIASGQALLLLLLSLCGRPLLAQTDQDAIMMSKNNFCTGLMYSHSSWTHYWEGSFKRNNENLGRVTTQSLQVMGNYGVSNRLNILAALPYIQTKASQGTLHGMKGLQDASLWIKWMPVEKQWGPGVFSLYGLAGLSFPVSKYVADFQPLSIGMHSKTAAARLMIDYQVGGFFATGSGTYTRRSNITIDRTAYYTTSLHLTNEVEMPDVSAFQLRTGYRSTHLIAEAILWNMVTLGGFDMRKNDMPFPSNKMNATGAGFNIKYTLKAIEGLSLIGSGNIVLAGRNIGQSATFGGGIFYILDFSHPHTTVSSPSNTPGNEKN